MTTIVPSRNKFDAATAIENAERAAKYAVTR